MAERPTVACGRGLGGNRRDEHGEIPQGCKVETGKGGGSRLIVPFTPPPNGSDPGVQ